MAKARTLVGLDVHATKIVAVVLDAESGELRTFRMNGDAGEAAGFCAALPGPVRATYEAGPTGYGLVESVRAVDVDSDLPSDAQLAPRSPAVAGVDARRRRVGD